MFHCFNIITVVARLKFVCQLISSGGSKIPCLCGEISWSEPCPYPHDDLESFHHAYSALYCHLLWVCMCLPTLARVLLRYQNMRQIYYKEHLINTFKVIS